MGARLFCVDGTNLVRTAYGYGGPAHAAQEDADSRALVEVFSELGALRDVEVEIFFDGAFRALGEAGQARLTFSREVSADELILDRVRAKVWGRAGTATVVTADAELGERAKAEGARWLRVERGAPLEAAARRIRERFER